MPLSRRELPMDIPRHTNKLATTHHRFKPLVIQSPINPHSKTHHSQTHNYQHVLAHAQMNSRA
eukprot:9523042-Lingulodinium_polyedra.AAC.1